MTAEAEQCWLACMSLLMYFKGTGDTGLKVRLATNICKIHQSMWGRVGIVSNGLALLVLLTSHSPLFTLYCESICIYSRLRKSVEIIQSDYWVSV